MREVITIRKTQGGHWQKRFDDYEDGFTRIREEEALESIKSAREKGDMFADDDENYDTARYGEIWFGYWN